MNTQKLLNGLLASAAVVLGLTACKEKGPHGNGGLEFDMMFTEEEITLEEGKSKNLEDYLVIEPESVADTLTVEYSTSNKKVATVSASGRVKALYEGRAVITASAHGKTAEINVRVKPVKIESFTVPSGTVAVGVGESAELEIGIAPENASPGHLQVTVSPDDARLKLEDNVWKFKSDHAGLYTITVSYGDVTKSFQVQSKEIAVSSVSMNKSSALLEIGKTLVLTATVSPSNATDKTLTWTSSDNTVATVDDGVCLAVKKGLVTITASASNGVKATCTLKVTDEDLSQVHLFSVGDGKQVRFSPGNLQFTTTGTHTCADGTTKTGTWRFAQHQYDYIGEGNSNMSSTYTGWVDLFGWGTTGYSVSPYTTSSSATYGAPTDKYSDWGAYNAIQNGIGIDEPGSWRVPTQSDFYYIIKTRANYANLMGVAQVNGVNGLVLLPDNWPFPAEVSFTPGVAGQDGAAYYSTVNNYSEAQWKQLENYGAVFLPAAGDRIVQNLVNVNYGGFYWTSSRYSSTANILRLHFFSNTVACLNNSNNAGSKYVGCSVRLVQDF